MRVHILVEADLDDDDLRDVAAEMADPQTVELRVPPGSIKGRIVGCVPKGEQ